MLPSRPLPPTSTVIPSPPAALRMVLSVLPAASRPACYRVPSICILPFICPLPGAIGSLTGYQFFARYPVPSIVVLLRYWVPPIRL